MKKSVFIIAASIILLAAVTLSVIIAISSSRMKYNLPQKIICKGKEYSFSDYACGCVMWETALLSDPYGNESFEAVKAVACAIVSTISCLVDDKGVLAPYNAFPLPHFMTESEQAEYFGDDIEIYRTAAKEAVEYAENIIIHYDGKPVIMPVSRISAGASADASEMGYDMPWCKKLFFPKDNKENLFSGGCQITKEALTSELLSKFRNIAVPPDLRDCIKVTVTDNDGIVLKADVCGITMNGYEVRRLLNIRSVCFEISYSDDMLSIKTRGDGDCTGLIVSAAAKLSEKGASCDDILYTFFDGLEILKNE